MKLHLTWPVSVAAAALVLAGCSSSDSGSTEESSASSSAPRHRRRRPPPRARELEKAAADYKAYAVAPGRRTRQGRQGVHRRGAGGRPEGRAGRVRAVAYAVGAHRAARRARRGRSTARPTPASTTSPASTIRRSPAGTGSSTCCSRRTPPRAARRSPTSSTRTSPTLKEQLPSVEVKPIDVANGAAELIEEVSRGQDHRRGGSLLQDRPVGLRRQPAGLAGRDRQAEPGPGGGRSRAARQDRRRHLRRSSTPCGRCARVTAGCSSAPRTVSSRRRGARRSR